MTFTLERPLNLTHCTLTGVDEHTDLTAIAQLAADYPFAEFGFLYSPTRAGTPGRYPSYLFLKTALEDLPPHVRVALHICGQGVVDLVHHAEPAVSDLVRLVQERNGRIQLNFNLTQGRVTPSEVKRFIKRVAPTTVITQQNAANAQLPALLWKLDNYAALFDASGGTGTLPTFWHGPLTGVTCGYAGGLGPDTLENELPLIATVAGDRPFWLDMESRLRTTDALDHDWFDIDAARRCLELVATVKPTLELD